jgi:DNA-binding transcriptional regulator YiaG
MPNFVGALKDEIRRLARKEAKLLMLKTRRDAVRLKRSAADLKRRMRALERENKRLGAAMAKAKAVVPTVQETGTKARITSKGVRSLRRKLGLSQADFAKLVGATTVSVWLWEKKGGALRLRDVSRKALLWARGLGAREAKERLAAMGVEVKRGRKRGRKAKAVKAAKRVAVRRRGGKRKARKARGRRRARK